MDLLLGRSILLGSAGGFVFLTFKSISKFYLEVKMIRRVYISRYKYKVACGWIRCDTLLLRAGLWS